MRDLFSLEGKNALLFGGGGDISIAVAKGFADYGAHITLFDISQEHLLKANDTLQKAGIKADYHQGNITDRKQLRQFSDEYFSTFGHLDILFNSAGITCRKSFKDMSDDEWDTIVNINLNGTQNILREFGLKMCEQNTGKIIQVLSTGAYRFGANFVAYGTTKAAQSALIKGLAIEWAPYNIHINGIAPTATETNFTRDYYKANPEKMEATINNHPYKRLGRPDDYVGAAIYLASSASDFVNGEVIIVDSGKTVK